MSDGGSGAAGAHIVIVDDEPDLRNMLARYLGRHGFDVVALDGGRSLRQHLTRRQPDLIVLDLNMPEEHGLSIARHLRETSTAAVLMLTVNSDLVDRIVGFEIGADDYLAKPADPRELLVRVRAILRRSGPVQLVPAAPGPPADGTVRMGRCLLHIESFQLLDEAGAEVPLTSMEFDLLRTFAERPNRVLTRDELLELAHNRDLERFDRSIDVRIARLRKKIERDPAKPQVIRTVRGAGYIFVPEGS
jgi:two-component system phosphate regulon response regulator OmpR